MAAHQKGRECLKIYNSNNNQEKPQNNIENIVTTFPSSENNDSPINLDLNISDQVQIIANSSQPKKSKTHKSK